METRPGPPTLLHTILQRKPPDRKHVLLLLLLLLFPASRAGAQDWLR
jgi:hypothetical protein